MSVEPDNIDNCPDCGVDPGQHHSQGCDVARCLVTGHQRLSCGGRDDHVGDCGNNVWTGQWPGVAECIEFGWWTLDRTAEGLGFVRCPAGTSGAIADLNRLSVDARWDRATGRWVLAPAKTPPVVPPPTNTPRPLNLIPADVRAQFATALAYARPADSDLAARVLAHPLMANDPALFRRMLALEDEVDRLRAAETERDHEAQEAVGEPLDLDAADVALADAYEAMDLSETGGLTAEQADALLAVARSLYREVRRLRTRVAELDRCHEGDQ